MAKDISKTLVVGLGGTGQTVIRDIKKRLLRTYGEIPKLVKFLEFDTDVNETNGTEFEYYYKGETFRDFKYQIENAEFLHTPFLGMELARRDAICKTQVNIEELSRVASRLNNKGAGGHRVCGRTILLQNSEDIIKKLRSTVTALRNTQLLSQEISERGYNVLQGGNINVFVIASLAGGTGSSSFLDMSRMLQIAGINVQYNVAAGQDQIFGMFFLPTFFEGKPHTQNIRVNAYTALSELDYTWGLNDESTYKKGCRELDEDNQTYAGQGGSNNGKRVVYTSVCLIDALTSKSQMNGFTEASSYVASFITSSIAADNTAIISSFANSEHKMRTVEGKYQNYSGVGFCELRFNRQDLVKYLLNRKLITSLEDYKKGNDVRTNEIIKRFIDQNYLNEGVRKNSEGVDTRAQMNQLTDAIISMTDPRFTEIHMGVVDTCDTADGLVETSKIEYLNRIAAKAQEIVKAFSDRKEELMDHLRAMLSERQSGKGFGIFPDLVQQLKTSLTAMKEGLEDEVKQHETDFDKIEAEELSAIKFSIKDNNPGGIYRRNARRKEQESWLQAYSNRVRFDMGNDQNPTLALLKVQAIRKREAISIYEEMIKIMDEFYRMEKKESIDGPEERAKGSFLKVKGMYDSLLEMLVRDIDSYKPKKSADKETLFADAYFKDYFEKHDADTMPLTNQDIADLYSFFNEGFTQLYSVDDAKLDEMREKLLSHLPVDGLIRKIQDNRMSIDDVFIECYGPYNQIRNHNDLESNPQLKMLQQLEGMFDPLWQHLPFTEGLQPCKNMIVGVYNSEHHIFNNANGYSATIGGWNTDQRHYVSLGDPDRIVFMLMETAVPGHVLRNVAEWANEYNQSQTYTFSDKRLEGIEMIMPGSHDESEIAWAYGWLFGLITNPTTKKALRVKPSYELAQKKGWVTERNGDYNYFNIEHPKDIYACHRKFINDPELSKDILDQAMKLLDSNPIDNIIKIKEWVNDTEKDGIIIKGKMWSPEVRGKVYESMSDGEKKIIQAELKYLAMRFTRLGYGLKLEGNRVVHTDSEVITHREEELKAKANKTKTSEE